MTTLATELWSGAASAALPAQWTTTLATGGSALQSGASYATLNPGASGSYLTTFSYLSGMTATVDTETTGWISHSVLTESYQYVSARATAATGATGSTYYSATGYTLLLYATSAGGLQLTVAKAGIEYTAAGQTLAKAGMVTANTPVNYRFRVTGTTTTRIQVRTWVGATEPTTWDLDFNDTTSPQTAAGKVRIASNNAPGRFGPLTVTDGVNASAFSGTLALSGSGTVGATGTATLPLTFSGASALAGSGSLAASGTAGPARTPLDAWTTAFNADNASLLMVGTSLTEGQGSTARANRWVERIQAPIRTRAGLPTGGVGYLPSWYNTWSPSDFTPFSAQAGTHAASNVTDLSLGRRVDNMSAGATKTYTITGTAADIHWIRGYGSFTYAVDGAAATTVSTAGTTGTPMTTRITLGTAASHSLVITATSAIRFSGIMPYNGDTTTGFRFFESGHSTYEASNYTGMGAMWAVVAPDLALVELGANEFLNNTATAAVLKTRVQQIISEIRAVAAKSLSVAVVVAGSWLQGAQVAGQSQSWATYQAALRSIATDDPTVGVIELPNLTSGQLNADAIHPNDTGQQLIADTMVAALAGAYTGSVSLSGSGTLSSAVGTVTTKGTSAPAGSGTLSFAARVTASGSLALSGSGATTLSGGTSSVGGVSLSGSGSLALTGRAAVSAALGTSGSGTLTLSGVPTRLGSLALTGSGTLTTLFGGATAKNLSAVSGVGTLALSGKATIRGALGLSGGGSLDLFGFDPAHVPAFRALVPLFLGEGAAFARAYNAGDIVPSSVVAAFDLHDAVYSTTT